MNIILQILIGFYIVEIFSGSIHWFEDSYFNYCTDIPILTDVIKANELHHFFPRSMLYYSYFENIKITFYITILIFIISFYFFKKTMLKYIYISASTFFFSVCVNIIHRFSHMRECELPYIITLLQKYNIIMSHDEHKIHHRDAVNRYFIMNRYTNTFFDSINFFGILERIIYKITGVTPNTRTYESYKSIQNYMHENAKLECPDIPTKNDIDILRKLLDDFYACA